MSTFDHDPRRTRGRDAGGPAAARPSPGKHTLVEAIAPAPIQRARDAAAAAGAPATGGSAALPAPTRARMEASFGTSFADARVHEDGEAAAVGARAFARGSDLHFAPGHYRPGTTEGDRLIGHELTHVVQQRNGRVVTQTRPIQRQGGDPVPTPPPVYQYAHGTNHGNDCGPASLLALVHMIDPGGERKLDDAILAHRPTDKKVLDNYLASYRPPTIPDNLTPSTPTYVCLQERLNVVRDIATMGTATSAFAKNQTYAAATQIDKVLQIGDIRTGLIRLLHFIGVKASDDDLKKLLPLGTDKPDGDPTDTIGNIQPTELDKHWPKVLPYLKRHATGAEVVVALGVPETTYTDKNTGQTAYAETGWGWGGTARPGYTPAGRDVGHDLNGHFVIIHHYDDKADQFAIIDPSFATSQVATPDQVKGFLAAHVTAAVVNLLVVPVSTLQGKVPPTVTPGPTATPAATGASLQASGATDHAAVVDDPALEAEADQMGARAAAGEPAHASAGATSTGPALPC